MVCGRHQPGSYQWPRTVSRHLMAFPSATSLCALSYASDTLDNMHKQTPPDTAECRLTSSAGIAILSANGGDCQHSTRTSRSRQVPVDAVQRRLPGPANAYFTSPTLPTARMPPTVGGIRVSGIGPRVGLAQRYGLRRRLPSPSSRTIPRPSASRKSGTATVGKVCASLPVPVFGSAGAPIPERELPLNACPSTRAV